MEFLQKLDPTRSFFLFTQNRGIGFKKLYHEMQARWPQHHFIIVSFETLFVQDQLEVHLFAGDEYYQRQTNVAELLKLIRLSVTRAVVNDETINFSAPCETIFAELPGWFGTIKNASDLSEYRLRQIFYFLSPEYKRLSYHYHSPLQDGRIFRFENLHRLDEAINFLSATEINGLESFILSLRTIDRMQK